MERVRNIKIFDLMKVLQDLSNKYLTIDLVIDLKNKKILIDPQQEKPESNDRKLTDDIILDLI